jgi:hypothetical protein
VLDPAPIQYTIKDDQGNVSNLATVTVDYIPVATTTARWATRSARP